MKLTYLPLFKRKFLKPCKKLFKFKFRRPLFTRSHRVNHYTRNLRKTALEVSFSTVRSFFRLPGENERKMDGTTESTCLCDTPLYLKAPHPSPLTPAVYVRTSGASEKHHDEVEGACRNFDKYLLEMIVEEGKMRNLSDVEELLYCWNNLNSPVFIDLVCRFYRELCMDLFSNTSENDIRNPKRFPR